ncbi:hypothetical protein [Paragemmobacter ruber]|uniref:hypothetical protein n=1 Tax=Paragemmobacter ruber TaxID=1985673 RepID=UPI001F473631|nr:hypothetical protein [Rhodobacter ruber]
MDHLVTDLRQAFYGRIETYSAELETFLDLIPQLDQQALLRLRRKAERSAACLNAAAQGLRAGQRRLSEMASAERADTYDRHGVRQALPLQGIGRRL